MGGLFTLDWTEILMYHDVMAFSMQNMLRQTIGNMGVQNPEAGHYSPVLMVI